MFSKTSTKKKKLQRDVGPWAREKGRQARTYDYLECPAKCKTGQIEGSENRKQKVPKISNDKCCYPDSSVVTHPADTSSSRFYTVLQQLRRFLPYLWLEMQVSIKFKKCKTQRAQAREHAHWRKQSQEMGKTGQLTVAIHAKIPTTIMTYDKSWVKIGP